MDENSFKSLKRGDLIRHKHSASAVLVDGNYGDRVIAVQTHDVTNPSEWDRVHPNGEVKCDDEP